jgi:hypothetical protein
MERAMLELRAHDGRLPETHHGEIDLAAALGLLKGNITRHHPKLAPETRTVWSLGCCGGGHPGDALELVRLALDHSTGYATASVRSMLYTREAWAYAKLGRISAFRRATSRAEDALTEAKPAEDP